MSHSFPESPFKQPPLASSPESLAGPKSVLGKTGDVLKARMLAQQGRVRAATDERVSNADILSIDAEALDKRALIDMYMSQAESIGLGITTSHVRTAACIHLLEAAREMHRPRRAIWEALVQNFEELQQYDERMRKINSPLLATQEDNEKIPMALLEDDALDRDLFEQVSTCIDRFPPDVSCALRARAMLWKATHGTVISPQERKQLEQAIRHPTTETRVLMHYLLAKICREQGESPQAYLSKAENIISAKQFAGSDAGSRCYATFQQDFGRYQSMLTQVDKIFLPLAKREVLIHFVENKAVPASLREDGLRRLAVLHTQNYPSVDDALRAVRVQAELGIQQEERVEDRVAYIAHLYAASNGRIDQYALLAATQIAYSKPPDEMLELIKNEYERADPKDRLTLIKYAARCASRLGIQTDLFTNDLEMYLKRIPKGDRRVLDLVEVLSSTLSKTRPNACEPYFTLYQEQLMQSEGEASSKWSWVVLDISQAALQIYRELHIST